MPEDHNIPKTTAQDAKLSDFKCVKIGDATLYLGDCLEIIPLLDACSVDLVLADLPYGIKNWTNPYEWDTAMDMQALWAALGHVLRGYETCIMFGAEPYSTFQRNSNIDKFKYDIIWVKNKVTSPMLAKVKPLRSYEIISVFSDGTTSPGRKNNMLYNPQGLTPVHKKVKNTKTDRMTVQDRPSLKPEYVQKFTGYPRDVVYYNCEVGSHNTQKPVDLLEYLILTYTDENDVVIDPTMGSGSSGVAAWYTRTKFIGIEKDERYFDIACERIRKAHEETLT